MTSGQNIQGVPKDVLYVNWNNSRIIYSAGKIIHFRKADRYGKLLELLLGQFNHFLRN